MFKRAGWILILLAGLVWLAACRSPTSVPGDEAAVRAAVEGLGNRLGMVSLLSPTAADDIRAQYAPYVAADLLETWARDPSEAPGRLTSSPWPDRIEIDSVAASSADRYQVNGRIIEISSLEATGGGSAVEIPVEMTVEKVQGVWLITAFSQGDPAR